jgi:hypothetical protein
MKPYLAFAVVLLTSVAAGPQCAGGAAIAEDTPVPGLRLSSSPLGIDEPPPEEDLVAADSLGPDVSMAGRQASPTPGQLGVRNAALIAGGSVLVGAYGLQKWWSDGFTGEFRTVSEGWFGQGTPYGGADKLGHAYFAYAGTRLLTLGLKGLGNDPDQARALGAWATLGVMTAVEIADGYSKKYKFSTEDAIMNVAGAALGYLMESSPDLDRLLDFRLLYKRSAGKFDPGGDYSGQKYLIAVKASGIPALREHPVLRYLEVTAGYGTRGFEGPPGVERTRHAYFGVSLNLSEILGQTVFRGARERGTAQRAADLFLEFIQVPGTAALIDHRM